MLRNSKESYWTKPPELQDLKTFSNDLIKITCVINNTVNKIDCIAKDVKVIVVEDGHRPVLGRDPFPQLGLSLTKAK